MNRIVWINEIEKIQILLNKGKTLEDIGKIYGVTKQRLYQVLTKFGLNTPLRNKKNFLKDKEPKYYWLNRLLCSKGVLKKDRMEILKTLSLPINCPILKMELNYNGTGLKGYSHKDNSPSIDRVDNNKGYTKDNIHVISWRANRIKNDSVPEELLAIGNYMLSLTK